MLVNARLTFISVDVWYKHLPNNTAVLTIGTIASLSATADRLRLTIINRDRTRPNETYIISVIPNRGAAAHWGAVRRCQLLYLLKFLVKLNVILR